MLLPRDPRHSTVNFNLHVGGEGGLAFVRPGGSYCSERHDAKQALCTL